MDLFKIFNPKSKSKRKSIKHRTPEDESITIIPESIIDSSVRRGDEARDRGEWEAAAAEYSAALLEDNSLSHVWVQLGHTVKEQGALRSASEAYKKALALQPNDFDTHVHIAHVFKRLGRVDSAVKHFLRALYFGLRSKSEEDELLLLLSQLVREGGFSKISDALDEIDALPPVEQEAPLINYLREIVSNSQSRLIDENLEATGHEAALVFDISDLIGYWRNARLPTGIQRVQIETIMAALPDEERLSQERREVLLCCFTHGREDWLEVPIGQFRSLCDLAVSGGERGDPNWAEATRKLDLHLALTFPFIFPRGSILVNLGTSWWLQNYFLYVRHAKATRGIKYIPFVHDMIPIMASEHCTRELTQDFITWALGVFDHADHFLVNSKYTSKDLQLVATRLGHQLDEDSIDVIPLDTDFRKDVNDTDTESALGNWQLDPGNFVLFVSTVESRKGHLTAFEAWSDLIDRHGKDIVPQLVCVGNRGWLNDEIYERLESDQSLSSRVTMLSGLSDSELQLLYRQCRFTLYPSLYEGWGLPVTESLCYGKVPLTSDAASLPEAGGEFAVYARAGDVHDLTQKAERLLLDDQYLSKLENQIAERFSPRKWSDLASQIIKELAEFRVLSASEAHSNETIDSVPLAHIGHWHGLTRNVSTRIWHGMSSAEKYRYGIGWYWPDERGSRVRGADAVLRFGIPQRHSGLRIMIFLCGDETASCGYHIVQGDQVNSGRLEPNEKIWISVDVPPSKSAENYEVKFGTVRDRDGTRPTYFVLGFHIYDVAKPAMRFDFVEAVALGNLRELDAFAEKRAD